MQIFLKDSSFPTMKRTITSTSGGQRRVNYRPKNSKLLVITNIPINEELQHTFCSTVDSKLWTRSSDFFNAACNRAISAAADDRALSISSLALK